MFDPLATATPSPFASSSAAAPPWPTTPHSPDLDGTFGKPRTNPTTPTKIPYDPNPREPQIYGQREQGLISPAANTLSNGSKLERAEPYVRIRLTALDRNRRDILIRFDAQTNLQNFNGSTYHNISRSYAEFQRFAEQIVYSNPQTIIPALPLPQTSAPTDEEDDRLVKIMLQRWLTRICEDPVVIHDEELRSFVESDFGYQPTLRPKRKTGSGFSILRRGVPDEDEELLAARYELTRLETQFFDAAKAIDKLSHARKALAVAHAEMGNKLISVASTETHPQLGNALRKFGRAWHIVGDSEQAYAINESVILGDSLGYQGMNSKAAKETLLQRAQALEEAQTAAKTTINKRRQIERLKASANIRPEKVDEALEELEEAQQIENILGRRVNGISQNLHKAIITHSRHAHDDITASLIEHARASLIYERSLKRELEAIRADVRAIGQPRAVVPPVSNASHIPGPIVPISFAPNPALPTSPTVAARAPLPASGPQTPIHTTAPPLPAPVASSSTSARPLDGTQSMTLPRGGPGPSAQAVGPSRSMTSTPASSSSFDPLSGSVAVTGVARPGFGPLGNGTNGSQSFGSASFTQPARNRIDQREAARKLANFL